MRVMEAETRYRGRSYTSIASSSYNFGSPSSYPFYDDEKKGEKKRERAGLMSLIIVLLFTFGVFLFVRYVDHKLPKPLGVEDIQENPCSFIEERARNDLKLLTSNGPRVAGSHSNDILTVDTLNRLVKDVQRTKNAAHNVEFEVQMPVGSFHMEFQDGLTSSYSNIPNVIVKLTPAKSYVNDSVLVNCHFDSVPGSPGASDDMISCAVMLEALRVLSRQSIPLRNSIVFLFNGAEENLLQGSHGFIKGKEAGAAVSENGHQWAKHVKSFLNLEAAGAGMREILFQTGPGNGWLLDLYRDVPYPWGSVVGEEVFQKGLIPSDTDFRIFRDFAKIPGLDMAFVKNGYVYHTKFDNVDNVTPGSLQHEGSNVLTLLKNLGDLDFSKIKYDDTNMVFFDVFGWFMIIYSENQAVILNLIVGFIVLSVSWKEADGNIPTIVFHVLTTLGAWIAGIACSIFVGLALNFLEIYSPYHSHPMMVFLIFGIPCAAGQVIVYSLTLKEENEDFAWIAGKTTLAVFLIMSTAFTRVVFSITYNLLFGIVGWYLARVLFRGVNPVLLGYKLRLAFYLIVGEAFPMALSLYLVAGCVDTFVPIMGRSGSNSNPNLFLAVLTSILLTLPTISGIVPVFVFFKKVFLRGCAVAMLLLAAVMVFGIGKIPYRDLTPMRIHLIEVDRSYHGPDLSTVTKRDAGFWLFNVDPNIPAFYDVLGEEIPELKHKNHVEIDAYNCEDLYCGLPFIFPVKKLVRQTHWISKENGVTKSITSRIRMDIIDDAQVTDDIRRITFSFVGPDHITVNFSPGDNYEIHKWSLTDPVPPPMSILWKGRPTYFVYHARGVSFERFNVTIDFKKKSSDSQTSGPLVDINFASFYLHGDEMKSQDLQNFIKRLPSWTYALGFTGVSHIYSIPA